MAKPRRTRAPLRAPDVGPSERRVPLSVTVLSIIATVVTLVVVVLWWQLERSPHEDESSIPSKTRQDVEAKLAQAISSLELGNHGVAESLLREILRDDPENGSAKLYLGEVFRVQGKIAEAIAEWEKIPSTSKEFASKARLLEGNSHLELGQAAKAEARLRLAVEMNPSLVPGREQLLRLYVLWMNRPLILEQLDAIQRLRPLSFDELGLRELAGEKIIANDDALSRLRTFVKNNPDDIESWVALARYNDDAGHSDDADRDFQQLLGRRPDDESVAAIAAQRLIQAEKVDAAARVLANHRLRDDSNARLWRSWGEFHFAQGQLVDAQTCFEKLVRIDPEDHAAHYKLGLTLQRLGQSVEGKEHLEASVVIDRLTRQVNVLSGLNRQQPDVMLPVMFDVAELLLRRDHPSRAADWYRLILSLRPADTVALERLRQAEKKRESHSNRSEREVTSVDSKKRTDTPPIHATATAPTGRAASAKSTESQGDPPSKFAADVRFRDVHAEAGVEFQFFNGETSLKYLIESMGGGVAVLDFDLDGWPDLYFAQGCKFPVDPKSVEYTDRLFRNLGNGRFVDVTERAGIFENGYSQGCTAGDFDNDGDPDLVVANYGGLSVFENNGDGTFREVSHEVGLRGGTMNSSLALADLDRDGDLDLYVVTYVDSLKVCRDSQGRISTCDPHNFHGELDHLYENLGNGKFEDVSKQAGIEVSDGKGLGIAVADFDNDGWPDIYVANDTTPNFFFRNKGTGKLAFEELGLVSGAAMSGDGHAEAGMGIAVADFDGNGNLDIFVTNYYLETHTMYYNQGGAFFVDSTRAAGLWGPTEHVLGFGTQWLDANADGLPDLFVANGHIDNFEYRGEPWKMPPQLFVNVGNGTFREVSAQAGSYFGGKYLGRGVARCDFNRDGKSDLVVVHQDRKVAILSNESSHIGHRIVLEAHGTTSNRDAIGTRFTIIAGGRKQDIEVTGGDGFYASNERFQSVGVGDAASIETLMVTWPDGKETEFKNLPVDCRIQFIEGRDPAVHPLH